MRVHAESAAAVIPTSGLEAVETRKSDRRRHNADAAVSLPSLLAGFRDEGLALQEQVSMRLLPTITTKTKTVAVGFA